MDTMNKYDRIERYLRQAITAGVYQPEDKLPSIRQLSTDKNVSKNTVIRAYQELEAVGLIYSVAKSGYRVKAISQPDSQLNASNHPPSKVDLLSICKSILTYSSEKERLPAGSAHPNIKFPAIKSLYAEIGRHSRIQSQLPSQYQIPPGNNLLIKQLLKISHDLGITAHYGDIAVTHGAQQGISLALRALTSKGDIVAVESPCFFGNLLLMESLGLEVVEIPSCLATGISPEALDKAISQWDIKAIIVTPNFSNPTGSRMTLEKRQRLLAVSKSIPIIEDDVFGALSSDESIPSLKSLDTQDRVIYINSLSKTLDSRLRIGWILSGRYQKHIERLLISDNMGSLNLMQSAVAEFLTTGKYRSHINKMKRVYLSNGKKLHQWLTEALNQYPSLQGRYHLTKASGSFIMWLTLPEHIDSHLLYLECKKEKIGIYPGVAFGTNNKFGHCLRLTYANLEGTSSEKQGIERLAHLIDQHYQREVKSYV
ncbi:PLP-dependent aminotransferase family protein [Vibrio genomosp. F10]|uniref:Transcriptional regulator n=1 Tax=Vibrio genomosp. F10 str. ZF-129 TaxID=1187848 RepID=A0A1E5BA67_9VIBR|nr:PLP-dependent aminotransferase family protein [Vibrio genomosp. F10]OEE30802.1 transcriptional regulator [Vibrio genomosp. F10 str. ZF-129]OEE95561.1 transcriptional regulator [Vibrio genomosp. F10 str. 9ZD137]OEE98110.1 transcriptional regulator [Vibrio genomosp. F10 str. 9ZC157]OEF05386.1 transcriptional regulator [Vibrio genomosp. F10 str. 9ZB36]